MHAAPPDLVPALTPPNETFNFAAHLLAANVSRPDKLAFIDDQASLSFSALDDAVRRLAEIAYEVNERTENIGARRLATVMERLLDDVSFDAPQRGGQTVRIDAAEVNLTAFPCEGVADVLLG